MKYSWGRSRYSLHHPERLSVRLASRRQSCLFGRKSGFTSFQWFLWQVKPWHRGSVCQELIEVCYSLPKDDRNVCSKTHTPTLLSDVGKQDAWKYKYVPFNSIDFLKSTITVPTTYISQAAFQILVGFFSPQNLLYKILFPLAAKHLLSILFFCELLQHWREQFWEGFRKMILVLNEWWYVFS